MDVVSEGRNATSSGTNKRESGAGSEPGGSDKESDTDEKVFMKLIYSYCFIISDNIMLQHLYYCMQY